MLVRHLLELDVPNRSDYCEASRRALRVPRGYCFFATLRGSGGPVFGRIFARLTKDKTEREKFTAGAPQPSLAIVSTE